MDTRNEIKSYIVREGITIAALVEKLADTLGYDIVWRRRKEV